MELMRSKTFHISSSKKNDYEKNVGTFQLEMKLFSFCKAILYFPGDDT